MQNKRKINIFMYENIIYYPPTISLIQCLLNNGYHVKLISPGGSKLSKDILNNNNFEYHEIKYNNVKFIISRILKRINIKKQYCNELKKIKQGEIIWTINPLIIRILGKDLLKSKNIHIMQLHELVTYLPMFRGAKLLKFNLKKYGQKAWKVVVPEINRAYIQKVGWKLDRLPYVLPNKPYYFNNENETDDIKHIIKEMKNEKRKIIIYLGVLEPDRNFEPFAKAVENLSNDYCLYMFGKCGVEVQKQFDEFCNKYKSVKYMGFVNPPQHLVFLKYARIALLPYSPESADGYNYDILNALYCAPNKIFEYSGSHLPMIGTDVLGLKESFEKYNIGVCCKDLNVKTIEEAIKYVDNNYDIMKKNTQIFFDSINIDKIVNDILDEE